MAERLQNSTGLVESESYESHCGSSARLSGRWLGAYGNEWVVTPNLDRLAAESVVFDRHISDCPEPVAACRAWLGREARLLPALHARGVLTVIVRANHPDTDGPDWYYTAGANGSRARPQEEDESPLDALLRSLPALLRTGSRQPLNSSSGSRSIGSCRPGMSHRKSFRLTWNMSRLRTKVRTWTTANRSQRMNPTKSRPPLRVNE